MTQNQKYPAYRDSGVKFIEEIPEGWATSKIKHICGINLKTLPENANRDQIIEYVDIGSVSFEKGITETESFTFKEAPSRARRVAEYGNIVVSTVRTYLKAIAFVDDKSSGYIYSTGFAVFAPNDIQFLPSFALYAFRSSAFTRQVDIQSKGMSYPAINSTEISNLELPVPPLSEQTAIANFLDDKTAKIDRAIAQKERLIALLKERKQILIQNAVTKGLDPTAKMKGSGIEWIGEIPEHWEVKKVFNHFYASKGRDAALLTKEYCQTIAGDFPVYSGQTSNGGVMGEINYYEFDVGSAGCLLSTTVGAKAMTCRYLQGQFSLSQNCMIIRPRRKLNTLFYYYAFQPMFAHYRNQIPDHMQASFRMEDLYQYRFLKPPEDEQREIISYISNHSEVIDRGIKLQNIQIQTLREYRATLIDSAVTGKIKVPGV